MSGQFHVSAALTPRNEPPLPIVPEAVSTPKAALDITEKKNLLPRPEIEPRPSSPVTGCYIDYSIPASFFDEYWEENIPPWKLDTRIILAQKAMTTRYVLSIIASS